MSIKAVLFDLDGTLLPMDLDEFLQDYFSRMVRKMAVYGYEPEKLTKAIYTGLGAMMKNDGSCTNEDALWRELIAIYGDKAIEDKPLFDDYYANEFQEARHVCGFLPEAAETVRAIRDMGYRVILATNPFYPSVATESRIRWAGLEPEDFELFTTYENSTSCKPNIQYYHEILGKIGLQPEECLMVGNDVTEDMVAETIGMKVFLLPADIINKEGKDISCYPQGDLKDLLDFVKKMRDEKCV